MTEIGSWLALRFSKSGMARYCCKQRDGRRTAMLEIGKGWAPLIESW